MLQALVSCVLNQVGATQMTGLVYGKCYFMTLCWLIMYRIVGILNALPNVNKLFYESIVYFLLPVGIFTKTCIH